MRSHILATLATLTGITSALTPAQWRSQSIYQVVTDRFAQTDGSTTASCNVNDFCGGTYQGLIKQLSYIQNMGFTAVWISPVVTNIAGMTADGSGYHGYWPRDIYDFTTSFGSASDLVALSKALHDRGMWLMVDVVTNHFANANSQANFDFTTLGAPFNDPTKFHPACWIDNNNLTSVQQCWMGDNNVALADIRTEDSAIQAIWTSWLSDLVKNFTIDGIRMDAAQHVDTGFIKNFQGASNGMHFLGEVYNVDPAKMCPYQNSVTGLMNYPAWSWITDAFKNNTGNIKNLVNGINTMKSTCKDVTLLGAFLENHDNPRFPALTSDQSLIQNAVAFAMLQDGIPIVYQGQEQKFWGGSVPYNREALWSSGYSTSSSTTLYPFITTLNKIRAWAIKKDSAYLTYNAWPIYNDTQTIIMRKGNTNNQVISVFTNRGASVASAKMTLSPSNSGFAKYQSVMDVIACKTFTTDSRGNLGVTITNGLPQVFYPTASLKSSGLCGQ